MPDDADDEVIQVDTSSYRPKRSPRGSFSAPNSPAVRNIFRNPQDLLSPQTARLHSHHAVARRGGGFAHQITSRAMSEAGSILSESMETAAQAAADLVKVPLTMAMVGIACLFAPLLTVFIAPLILLFTPLLLSLGFGLTAFGLGRAGLIGSLHELNQLATKRGERIVRQVTALVRSNLSKATREVSGEVEQHLHALQRELQSWAYANPNIKPYCHGHIGWLLRKEARDIELRPELDLSGKFEELFDALPPPDGGRLFTEDDLARVPLPDGMRWHDLSFLLVPGLLTKWYPMYMKALRSDMKRLGLHAAFSRVDTDQPVRINAARLRHEVLEMAQAGRKIVLLGHSKGAVDAAAALSLFPELCDFVAGLVSLQGPHGGSAIAHDLSNTHVQKTVVLGALEKLLRGCKHAVLDLSFESRQEFVKRHAYPLERVPTLCVATAERRQSSLLTPLIEYVAVRYGAVCDGLVCQADAVLPHCVRVVIDDMDHFGPAWGSFPATDRYDPTRLWLSCISLALRFGGGGGRPSAALAGGSLRGGSSMRTSPDTAAAREEVA